MSFLRRVIAFIINLFKKDYTHQVELPGEDTNADKIAPWMKIARQELGQQEKPGSEHNKRILEYGQHVDLEISTDEVAWCSSFVNYVLARSGYEGTKSALARSFTEWGREIEGPVYGCIVVFQRGDSSWKGHVGFFVGFDGGDLLILGGNQSNKVNIQKYPRKKVLAYRMPE